MSIHVCLSANTLYYASGGGHLWVYLNWALGLKALNCHWTGLEQIELGTPAHEAQALVTSLKSQLERYGLAERLALISRTGEPLAPDVTDGCVDYEACTEADLLLNLQYALPADIVRRFRRTAL